jgi:hypothetical protein
MNDKPHVVSHSLERALSAAALKTLAQMKPADFVASLKRQGINSLDDLATKALETAQSATQAGVLSVDPEVFGICYKFSAYRPHFGPDQINTVVNTVQSALRT